MTRDENAGTKTMEYLSFWLIYILIWRNLCIFWINGNNLKTAHSKMVFWDSLQKNTDIFMFSFEWLKRDWQPYDCCLQSKFFYLSILPRITLPLVVNFMWCGKISVSKISFIFLITLIDSTNDQNIVTIERSELAFLYFHE